MPDFMNLELLWFLVGLVLIIAELFLPGFIIIFFGIGAWVAAVVAGAGWVPSFNGQLLVFLAASGLTLLLFRKQGKKYFEGKVSGKLGPDEDVDDVRGGKGIVTSDISPGGIGGKVEFRGTLWEAEADNAIPKGTVIEIVERRNLTVKVKPLQEKGLSQ